LAEHRVNGIELTTSMHVGTHLDGELHFVSSGRDIASIPLERLFGEGVIVDISDQVDDYDIYYPEHITSKVTVKKHDILIIHTGYHRYAWYQEKADEERYFLKHPGPSLEFAKWVKDMQIKWIGVDCGSADHPMNTVLRRLRPDIAREAEEKLGKPLDELFPPEHYQLMHNFLFPDGIIHAENLGGDIEEVLNKRALIGCFPFKFVGGESALCRIVAFIPEE
jgi:kynurenine formamidase